MSVLLQNTNAAKHADKIRLAEQVLVLHQQIQQRESLNSKETEHQTVSGVMAVIAGEVWL